MSKIGEMDLQKQLNVYSETITRKIKALAKKICRNAVSELENTSPKKRSRYAESWKYTVEKDDGYGVKVIVNNKLAGLTHLLENGHQLAKGGFSPAKVHIKPVEQKANEEFEKGCEEIIKNA